eukprot:gene9890-13329_t
MAGVDLPMGVALSASVRLDEKTLELRRTDATASISQDRYQTSVTFTQLEAQPEYGFKGDNQSISTSSSVKVTEYWSVFGSTTYDIDANKFSSRSVGLSYADECMILSLAYKDSYDPNNQAANDWTVGGRLTFRTLGDIQLGIRQHSAGERKGRQMASVNKGKNLLIATAIALSFSIGPIPIAGPVQAATQVVAVVNKTAITNSDVNRRAAFLRLQRRGGNLQKIAKEEMVEEALKREEIARVGMSVSTAEVDASFERFAQSNNMSVKQLNSVLDQAGVGAAHFKAFI